MIITPYRPPSFIKKIQRRRTTYDDDDDDDDCTNVDPRAAQYPKASLAP